MKTNTQILGDSARFSIAALELLRREAIWEIQWQRLAFGDSYFNRYSAKRARETICVTEDELNQFTSHFDPMI